MAPKDLSPAVCNGPRSEDDSTPVNASSDEPVSVGVSRISNQEKVVESRGYFSVPLPTNQEHILSPRNSDTCEGPYEDCVLTTDRNQDNMIQFPFNEYKNLNLYPKTKCRILGCVRRACRGVSSPYFVPGRSPASVKSLPEQTRTLDSQLSVSHPFHLVSNDHIRPEFVLEPPPRNALRMSFSENAFPIKHGFRPGDVHMTGDERQRREAICLCVTSRQSKDIDKLGYKLARKCEIC